MSGFGATEELCDICRELLRIVETQGSLLAQFGAMEDEEAAESAKRRLQALQSPLP